jgi:hypothetical protein
MGRCVLQLLHLVTCIGTWTDMSSFTLVVGLFCVRGLKNNRIQAIQTVNSRRIVLNRRQNTMISGCPMCGRLPKEGNVAKGLIRTGSSGASL